MQFIDCLRTEITIGKSSVELTKCDRNWLRSQAIQRIAIKINSSKTLANRWLTLYLVTPTPMKIKHRPTKKKLAPFDQNVAPKKCNRFDPFPFYQLYVLKQIALRKHADTFTMRSFLASATIRSRDDGLKFAKWWHKRLWWYNNNTNITWSKCDQFSTSKRSIECERA